MPTPRPPARRTLLLFILPGIVAALLTAGAIVWRGAPVGVDLPRIGGPFSLIDGAGKTVTDRDFRGRYMLVYFGYTFCPDVCPTTLADVATALDALGPKADRVQPLFITVDPKRDTPAVIGKYVAAFTPRLIGLTGSPSAIADVAREYRVYYAEHRTGPGPDDYTMDHSSILYLMGPDGTFRTLINAEPHGTSIADDLARQLT